MPLAEVQCALAHLYTDEASRELLRADATAFATRFGLNDTDAEQVASMGGTRLRAYTDSLDRKRLSACLRELPLSARAMGPRFRHEFLRYARRVPLGDGRHRYRDDASAFARHLASRSSAGLAAPLRTLIAYEANRRPGIRCYGFDVRELARSAQAGVPVDGAVRKLTFVVRAWPGRQFAVSLYRKPAA